MCTWQVNITFVGTCVVLFRFTIHINCKKGKFCKIILFWKWPLLAFNRANQENSGRWMFSKYKEKYKSSETGFFAILVKRSWQSWLNWQNWWNFSCRMNNKRIIESQCYRIDNADLGLNNSDVLLSPIQYFLIICITKTLTLNFWKVLTQNVFILKLFFPWKTRLFWDFEKDYQTDHSV